MTGVRAAAVVVPIALLSVLVLGGCRGAERAAAPAATTPEPPAAASVTAGTLPTGPARSTADPLSDIEASVDAIARDLDSDADAERDTGR